MIKSGQVFIQNTPVGRIWQDENGYWFKYSDQYLQSPHSGPVSQTLPVREAPYHEEKTLPAFFDGLIPEGWLLDIAVKNWKINEKDRMELLLTVCKDCIGAVSIIRDPLNDR